MLNTYTVYLKKVDFLGAIIVKSQVFLASPDKTPLNYMHEIGPTVTYSKSTATDS